MNIRKIIREEMDNTWGWAMESQPLELQDPRNWIGSSFGYGQRMIDDMYDYEIQRGDNLASYEIVGVEGDSLLIVRDHPRFGRGGVKTKVYIRGFIDEMNNGNWVWK